MKTKTFVEDIETYAQDIVDTVREPLLMLDTNLRVHSANSAFYGAFHVSPEETENQLIYELGNGQWDIPDLRRLLEDVIPASSVFNDFELEHTFPVIGRRVMLLNARKLRAGTHSAIIVLAMEDVTDRRRAEEAVAKAKEASELANRTKSMFLANMSHELRTPLNAIVGYAEMLQEEAIEQNLHSFSDDLAKINTSGRHLLALINDILDLSKIEAGKMELDLETFDLNTLIDDVVSTIQPMVDKNSNELKIERPFDLGGMLADEVKVRQALFNLLSNAAKFTRSGLITLNARRERMDSTEWIVFKVTDTGIGLSALEIVKLFKDFTQADTSTTRKFGGTGLGLALTRRFCQMMGGDVTVSSVAGEGSVFTMKLPALVPAMKPDRRRGVVTGASEGAEDEEPQEKIQPSTCVLVIDDDAAQRDLMRRFLTKDGFTVRTAASGEEGLRLARELLPVAITLDVMMPDIDGWAVLEALKADPALCDIPVVMLTMVDDSARGHLLGAAEFVTKPVNRRRLARILQRFTCSNPPCPIMIVDDDPMTRELLKVMLEARKWRVMVAENGEVALALLEKETPRLIFLDLMMPVMDGFEFADRLRRHPQWRSIPIVVVTSHDLTADERRRLNGYVETVIQKDGGTREELMAQVRDSLEQYARPSVSAS